MHIFDRYVRYFWRERWMLLLGVLCLIPSAIIDLNLPRIIKNAIDQFGTRPVGEFLYVSVAAYLGLAVCKGFLRFGMRWFIVTSSRRFEASLRNDLVAHLTTLSFPYFNKTKTGDLLARATQDVEGVRMFLGPGFMYVGDALVRIPIAIYILSQTQPVLVLAMTVSLGALAISVKFLTPKLHKHSEAQQAAIGKLSDRANETFAGSRVLKAFAREDAAISQFNETASEYRDHSLKLISVRALSDVFFAGAKDFTFFILFAVGSILYVGSKVTVGELYLFLDYTTRLYWPVFVIGWMVSMYPRARAAAKRLDEVFDAKPDIADGPRTDVNSLRGTIEFRDVTFSYKPGATPVLNHCSFKINAGETVAIVGRTGSGKTTIVNLLGRFFDTDRGHIFADGIDIHDLPVRTLRSGLGYVPQDHFLFSDSILENIAFASSVPDPDLAARCAKAACLDTDLQTFPDGLATVIGERGVTLSGGQRQRVAIARALYADPRILVLDDALSAVDLATEEKLVQQLKSVARGRTTILISHRLSTVRHADRIFVLHHGSICEEGTHAELVRRRGLYAETWWKQQLEQDLDRDDERTDGIAATGSQRS